MKKLIVINFNYYIYIILLYNDKFIETIIRLKFKNCYSSKNLFLLKEKTYFSTKIFLN